MKAWVAGAIALALAGAVPASAAEKAATGGEMAAGSVAPAVDSKIMQAKAALHLRPDQERHWPRIAAAIRAWAYQSLAEDGAVNRGGSAQMAGARRVLVAAMPLMRSLDSEQKQTAIVLVRALGFGDMAAGL